MSFLHALQAVVEAAPAVAPATAETAGGLLGAFARFDSLALLFLVGSAGLLWMLVAFIRDDRDVHDGQAEP